MTASVDAQVVKRVMVGTDRSRTAERAVRWASDLAETHGAELLLLQVIVPPASNGATADVPAEQIAAAEEDLGEAARALAGSRGRARVVVNPDPAQAVLDAVDSEHVDVLVVGNVGMSGRKEFLLGNLPNRISHNARCTVVIVNTADPAAAGASHRTRPRTANEGEEPTEGELLSRALRIGRVLFKAGGREMLNRSRPQSEASTREAAQRFRSALDELGPTFAKLGQILSTRPDLIPPAFQEELATLQERVTPLTEAEVVGVMEQELHVPWEDVFGSIDPVPMAAGTIAQVHRATLETGERVVVKVQRPTAERDIMQDLGLLEMFAQRAASRPALRRVFDVPAMIEFLSASLRRELDFRREAANILHMGEVLEPFSRLDVPKVYEEYSTSRLLVMQEIQGVPVREAPPGETRDEAARQLLESYYHQVMVEGFFHADPHPGNMKWWNDKIYFLDMGMVGELDAQVRRLILLLMLAFSEKDASFLSEIVLMLAPAGSDTSSVNFEAFQADVGELVDRYRNLSLREMQLGPIFQEVATLSAKHNVRIPAELTLVGKAFAQMQLVAADLDPALDPFSVAESFLMRSTMRQLSHNIDPKKLYYEGQKAWLRLDRMLTAVEEVVGARPGKNLEVDLRGTEQLEETIARAGLRVSMGIGIGGTLVLTAIIAGSERVPRWVPALTGGIGSVLAARLLADRPRRRR